MSIVHCTSCGPSTPANTPPAITHDTALKRNAGLAPSVAVMKAAPTLQQTLSCVLGQDKADALLERWRKSVQSAQTFDVEAKPELSAY